MRFIYALFTPLFNGIGLSVPVFRCCPIPRNYSPCCRNRTASLRRLSRKRRVVRTLTANLLAANSLLNRAWREESFSQCIKSREKIPTVCCLATLAERPIFVRLKKLMGGQSGFLGRMWLLGQTSN